MYRPYTFVPLQTWCHQVPDIAALLTGRNAWLLARPGKLEPFGPPDFTNDPEEAARYGRDETYLHPTFALPCRRFAMELDDTFLATVADATVLRANFHDHRYLVIPHEGIVAVESYGTRAASEIFAHNANEVGFFHAGDQRVKVHLYDDPGNQTVRGENGILLAQTSGGAYAHFLLEVLPRFWCYRTYPELRAWPALVQAFAPTSFQAIYLEALAAELGIRLVPLTAWATRFDRLLVPTFPAPGGFAREQLDLVESSLKRHFGLAPTTARRRLFISRRDARNRRVLNEPELLAELAPLGFENLTLDGMGIDRQVQLFQEAAIVVAPHGAGNANLIFTPANSLFIELVPRSYPHPMYWMIAKLKGLRHARLLFDDDRNQDMVVDVREVRATLAELAGI